MLTLSLHSGTHPPRQLTMEPARQNRDLSASTSETLKKPLQLNKTAIVHHLRLHACSTPRTHQLCLIPGSGTCELPNEIARLVRPLACNFSPANTVSFARALDWTSSG